MGSINPSGEMIGRLSSNWGLLDRVMELSSRSMSKTSQLHESSNISTGEAVGNLMSAKIRFGLATRLALAVFCRSRMRIFSKSLKLASNIETIWSIS